MKRALITGIAGQDGSYLAEFLLKKGYQVYAIDRKRDVLPAYLEAIKNKITLVQADLLDMQTLVTCMREVKPDEIYNLAAQSLVQDPRNPPSYTFQVNTIAVYNLLEAVRVSGITTRFFQPSSSAMYGDVTTSPQNEKTPFNPKTPYAISKLAAHELTEFYRDRYTMFCGIGILYNHESPRRSPEAIMRKVVSTAVKIKHGEENKLKMGTLDTHRDQGFAGDYAEAMWMILQHEKPDVFVIATGEVHSIRELVGAVFKELGMDYEQYYEFDERFARLPEKGILVGDISKIKMTLGWQPRTKFKELIKMMIESENSKR